LTELALIIGLGLDYESVFSLLLFLALISTWYEQVQKIVVCVKLKARRLQLFTNIGEELAVGATFTDDVLILKHNFESNVWLSSHRFNWSEQAHV
jgi:hypothetical protein